MVIFGQDPAIDTLVSAIKLARSGLGNPDKPIGNFLFSGPTGVGKTEVTRQLALQLGIELVRFDMSEYMEPHSVSRLIGAPPGYVGFDQGGLLTEKIVKTPHCVLLLDEVEKAHPDIFNILLQVMDRGVLTDTNGREANFKNVILVMTTNAGAAQAARRTIGFTRQDHSTDAMEVIRRSFSPEFRNRLDAVVQFQALGFEHILRVVDKFLIELEVAAAREERVAVGHAGGARLAGPARLRPADGRPPDGPRDPGQDQAAAGGRTAVRQAGRRRQGLHRRATKANCWSRRSRSRRSCCR